MFMLALENDLCPPSTLDSLINLAMEVWIDQDPMQERLSVLNRMWDDLGDEAAHEMIKEEIDGLFDPSQLEQLFAWIAKYLGKCNLSLKQDMRLLVLQRRQVVKKAELKQQLHLAMEEEHVNTLTLRVLEMVERLVEFSYYHSKGDTPQ